MTARDKLKYGFKRAYLSPMTYTMAGVGATITQMNEEDQPHKDTGDEVADGLSRFAIKFATSSTRNMFTSGIYPAVFKQTPRYRPSGKKGVGRRALYAASRVFVTEGDDGGQEPNISRLGGTLTASALANIWERSTPGRDRIGVGPTMGRFGTSVAMDVVQFIVIKEFGRDIKKLFKR